MDALLSTSDLDKWVGWKRATERVMREVAREIADATGLSAADFSVLTRLIEEGDGGLRQQVLADQLGWERSRLSRQLGRMESRNLVIRRVAGPERWIDATETGTETTARARVAHAHAVRKHLLEQVTMTDRPTFWNTINDIAANSDDDQQSR